MSFVHNHEQLLGVGDRLPVVVVFVFFQGSMTVSVFQVELDVLVTQEKR